MVLTGQKPIMSFGFSPMTKHPMTYAKTMQKRPVLILVLYPRNMAIAIARMIIMLSMVRSPL